MNRRLLKWCLLVLEKDVAININEAYSRLKDFLIKNNCTIITEEVPTEITVKQGSVWGVSPRSAKKIVSYRLSSRDSKTHIMSSSYWTADYKNLTLIGSVSSFILAILCLWISTDIQVYVRTLKPGFWSFLANTQGLIDVQKAQLFINLTRLIVVFLAISLVLEIMVVVYAHSKIDDFAAEAWRAFT
jgi:hypothetical protein